MNDPVLNRAMFRPAVAPMSSYGTGIASNVASPDEAARALQTAFQPTGYAGGGQVINGVKHFKGGGENQSGERSFLGGMFRLPAPDQVLTPRRYTPVQQAQEDAAALEPAAQTMNPEDVIVPRRYGTVRSGSVRSGFYRAGEGSPDATTMEADPNFDLPPSEEWKPESQFGRDIKGLLPERTTDEEAKARLKAMSDEIKRKRQMMENVDEVRNAPSTAEGSPIGDYFRSLTPQQLADREAARAKEVADRRTAAEGMAERLPPPAGGIATVPVRDAEASKKAAAAAAARFDEGVSSTSAAPSSATPPAVPPPADKTGGEKKVDEESGLGKRLSLRIDELKQERAANKAQQRENQLLALMQAGFAAAAGKSSSALTNIAAGGSSGIATLADLEKTRRAEDTALRKEALDLELAKEKLAESAKERIAAREERGLSRDITGLKAVSDANKGLIVSYENQILALEKLQDAPATPDDKKKEYAQLIAQKRAEIDRLGFEYRQQAQGLLPKGMRTPNLDFQTTVRGSRPTQAGT